MLVENLSFPQDMRVRQEAFALTAAGYQVSVISPRSATEWHEVLIRYRFTDTQRPEKETVFSDISGNAYSVSSNLPADAAGLGKAWF